MTTASNERQTYVWQTTGLSYDLEADSVPKLIKPCIPLPAWYWKKPGKGKLNPIAVLRLKVFTQNFL
ncbi:MAG: hypothetical protein IPH58_16670 [Sphingobacteriales bacterium]|nr:hypothetical protein [Sphingobacteriales bacterium]